MSAQVPVVVFIDDADCLDGDLALALIENLAARHNGHVLTVAVVDPEGALKAALTSRARMGIMEGRVHVADADPDMGLSAREDLTRELRHGLPEVAVRRIARGTATLNDVLAVATASRLAEISAGQDEEDIVAAVDAVLAAQLKAPEPSPEAVAIAWAGGILHALQATAATAALGTVRAAPENQDVLRWLELVRSPIRPHLD